MSVVVGLTDPTIEPFRQMTVGMDLVTAYRLVNMLRCCDCCDSKSWEEDTWSALVEFIDKVESAYRAVRECYAGIDAVGDPGRPF